MAWREAVWITLIALATTLVALSLQYLNTVRVVDAEMHALITAEVESLRDRYDSGGLVGLATALAREQHDEGVRDYFYLLAHPDGRPIAGNLERWPRDVTVPGWYNVSTAIDSAQGMRQRLIEARSVQLKGGFRLLVGHLSDGRLELRNRFFVAVGWSVLATGLMGLGLGFWRSRRALRFVEAVSDTGDRFLAGRLSERVPVSPRGDEYDRLAETINACFAEVERMVDSLRSVTDGMAHDLKTPLTRIRARLELAQLQHADAAALSRVVDETGADLQTLLQLINDMLRLARAEATEAASFVAVDLQAVTNEILELYRPVAEDKQIVLTNNTGPAFVLGARPLLAQLVANLLDNAIKYTPGGGKVALTLAASATEVLLVVADSGPGIPTAERDRVLTRFVQLDASRQTPGAGLGLSLVDTIVRVHRGRLILADNDPGLRIEVRLPPA